MSVYLCYYLDRNGAVPTFDTVEASTHSEALTWAERLLQRWPEREGVEVWQGDRRISIVHRTAQA